MQRPESTPPSRFKAGLVGALMFGAALPVFCALLTAIGLSMVTGRTRDETVGLAGFMMAGLAAPVGAVVGAFVSAFGAPERVRHRRMIAAAVLTVLSLALWGSLVFGT